MKPVIQRHLDALEARIRALEVGAARLAATALSLADLTETVGSGRLWLGRQFLTGSGTYVPTAGTARIVLAMVGGGGGGGGAATGISVAGGGSSGGTLELVVGDGLTALTGGSYAAGAGGAAGSSAGGTGGVGGNTSIAINGTTYTALGGSGGPGQASNVGGYLIALGGNVPVQASLPTGSFAGGGPGETGLILNNTFWFSGRGGSSPFGPGGAGQGGTNPGTSGSLYGGGGGGAAVGSGNQPGGPGAPGCIIVDEYI